MHAEFEQRLAEERVLGAGAVDAVVDEAPRVAPENFLFSFRTLETTSSLSLSGF